MMNDKYRFSVEWSEEDNCYLGSCLELNYLIAHGDTPEEALSEIKSAVEGAIELLKEDGKEAPEPLSIKSYKGRILLRVNSDFHKKLSIIAAENNYSLNQNIITLLEKALYISETDEKISELNNKIDNMKYILDDIVNILCCNTIQGALNNKNLTVNTAVNELDTDNFDKSQVMRGFSIEKIKATQEAV